jgi:hypothetical protein
MPMNISFRRPDEGPPVCSVCGARFTSDPSRRPVNAPCPNCGYWGGATLPAEKQQKQLSPIKRIGDEIFDEMPFAPAVWHRGSMRERGAMARDLVRHGSLLRLTETHVLNLLGRPERGGSTWEYALYLGVRITHLGSPHRLCLRFDESRQVCEASIVE